MKPFVFIVLLLACSCQTANEEIGKAKMLYQEQQYNESISILTAVLSKIPKHAAALEYTGHCYHALGKYDSAYIFLTGAIQQRQKNYELFINAGDAAFKIDKPLEALNLFLAAYSIDSLHDDVNYNLAMVYWLKMQANQKALQHLQREIELNPTNAEAYAALGQIYLTCDSTDLALSYYDKAITLDAKNYMLYLNRGFAWCNAGNWNQAINDFTVSNNLNNSIQDAIYYRAVAYLNTKKTESACTDLNTIKPGNEFSKQADSLLNVYCK